MFNVDDIVTYINPNNHTHSIATITNKNGNVVSIESSEFDGLLPSLKTFNAETGNGLGDYMDTMIVEGARDLPTHIQLGMWIEKNTEVFVYGEVFDAMIRFVACEEAKKMLEDITIFEFATILIEGISESTIQSVDDWLVMWYEQYNDDEDVDANALLVDTLNHHYNLKTTS